MYIYMLLSVNMIVHIRNNDKSYRVVNSMMHDE